MNVLLAIVEDSGIAQALRAAVADTDVLIIEPTAERAARRLVALRADKILVDDGPALDAGAMNAIRAVAPETPVLVLSGRGDVMTDAEWRAVGADGVLAKPFSCEELQQALGHALERIVPMPRPAIVEAPAQGQAALLNQHRMALRWLSRSAAHGRSPERLAGRLIESAVDIFDAVRGAVLLENKGRVRVTAHFGIPESIASSVQLSYGTGLMRWFDAHACLFDLDAPRTERTGAALAEEASKELRVLHGRLAVPLLRDGLVAGAIVVGEKASGAAYSAEERELLTLVARSTSMTFEQSAAKDTAARGQGAAEEVLQHIAAGVLVVNADKTVRALNPAAESLLGITAVEVLGRSMDKLSAAITGVISHTLEDGSPREHQRVSDAAARQLEISTRALPDGGVAALIAGAAAERIAEEEIVSSPFWEYLSSRVAQEIKNPMVAINTFAQLLPRKYDSEEFRDAFSRVVQKEVRRINGVVETLFAFARNPQPRLRKYKVNDAVRDVLQSFEEELASRMIALDTSWDPSESEAEIDPVFFSQALHNVVQNSIDAMPSGGTLSVKTKRQHGHAEINISDTGPGVDKQDEEHIFLPFYSTKEKGMGLGLPIANRILQQHQGNLKLAPGPSGGGSFTIHLPAAAGSET